MKFAPIALAAAALLALHIPAEATIFQSISGTGFTTETTSVVNLYLLPAATAGSSVASYSVLITVSGFSNIGTINFATPVNIVHVPVGFARLLQPVSRMGR